MVGVIAEHIKTHRHQLRKHVLFVGSMLRIPPRDQAIHEALGQMAIEWAKDRVAHLDEEERAQAALEMLASEEPDHIRRCAALRAQLDPEIRPAEGHVRLSRLIKDGYYSTVFTSEPDDLLERALRAQHLEPEKDYNLLVAGMDDPKDIKIALEESSRITIVKCGGDLARKFLPLSVDEMTAVAASIRDVFAEFFRLFSVFVALGAREYPFLELVPREGARIFWINTLIPMGDAELYDELKLENPASADFHAYQPNVTALLEARHSARHLLCREPGSFNEFFAKLHTRLVRRKGRSRDGRRDLKVIRGGPYRFLDFFDLEDEDFYFGREDDVRAVLDKVRQAPITVVFGKLAIGKTSLLRAGIMASLRQESEEADKEESQPWLVAYTRVGDDPIASIRAAIVSAVAETGHDSDEVSKHEQCCEFITAASTLTGRQVVVLLDQFAEYFVKLGDRVRQSFVDGLREALDKCADHFRVLIAIREDYVGELFELQDVFPEIMHNMHRLRKLTREQAEDAIVKPAQNFELQVERSLVRRIADDLYRDGVEPSQLQVVMHSLYESLSPGGRVITERRYDRAGTSREILDKYLERVLGQLPANEKKAASRVLVFLAGGSELKAAQPLERIVAETSMDREVVERVLAHLVDVGLLRPVGRGRDREYELTHEILADKIQSDLAGKQVMLRDIQDLLTRELNNAERFGLLIGPEELRLIGTERDDLVLGPAELRLVIRSALTAEVDADYWFDRVWELQEDKADFLAVLMRDEAPHVRLHAYAHLARHLEAKLIRHLVHGLEDEEAEIRKRAVAYLSQLDKHLLSMLENRDLRVRTLAARAVGATGDRRHVRPLIEAFTEGAAGLREELTNALITIDDARAPDMLLRAVVSHGDQAWPLAYALGRLSVGEEDVKALAKASGSYAKPELLYALGVARTYRRNFDGAAQALADALQGAPPGEGLDAIHEAEQQVEVQRARASAGEDAWLQFGRLPSHTSYTEQEVPADLEVAWTFHTKDPVVATPVVRDNTVYIGSRDRHFYAIDTGKGTPRWTFTAAERIEGAAAISSGLVFFGALDGSVYALELLTGNQRWARKLGSAIRSSCVVDGNALYLGTRNGRLVRLDTASGDTVWEQEAAGEISSSPAIVDGTVVFGCWDGCIFALGADNGVELWRHRTQAAVSSSPSISDGVVYCGSDDSHMYAINLDGGGEVWRRKLGGQVRSSAAIASDRIVVGCVDGNCYALSREDGSELWRTATEDAIMSSPAISSNVVYVASKDGGLYAMDLATGEVVWKHASSYGVYSSPAIAEQTIFIGFGYYDVVAFRPQTKAVPGK